jgi:tRNA-dihydrouridine synthase A
MENKGLMPAHRFSVAPMMDWTDRHCRLFHRAFTRRALLYAEMVTADALLHGPADRLLARDPGDGPVAVQLGGAEPEALGRATAIAVAHGFDEVNLNVGCPSDRVQSGCFGAALMLRPERVAECIRAMIGSAGPVPVTVKCRIGVDEQEPCVVLPNFLEILADAGIGRVAIHARKAWLRGLSPKANRTVPPLDHGLVAEMKATFPQLAIVVNGGIADLPSARAFLDRGFDGVMLGRAAYQTPAILGEVDRVIFGAPGPDAAPEAAVRAMLPHIERERTRGTPLPAITRHMLGAFAGRPGARAWRRLLSEEARRPGAGPDLVERALTLVRPAMAA